MGVGGALRDLGEFLDDCEAAGELRGVDLAGDIDIGGAGDLTAEVAVQLSACPLGAGSAVSLAGASLADDGRLELGLETDAPVVPNSDRVGVEVADATVADDGTVLVTLAVAIATDGSVSPAAGAERSVGGGAVADEGAVTVSDEDVGSPDEDVGSPDEDVGFADNRADGHTHEGEQPVAVTRQSGGGAASSVPWRDRDVPPFRDPDLLREVYESCDTFAEMPAALGMDVTAETVRRYMIDYGIHEPNRYDTGRDEVDAEGDAESDAEDHGGSEKGRDAGDTAATDTLGDGGGADGPPGSADGEPPVVLTDGIGLPDDVTVDTIIETVRESNTIYEVQRDIGIPREDALEMLRDLNLLDLVVGRLATSAQREISRAEVLDRLRQRADAV